MTKRGANLADLTPSILQKLVRSAKFVVRQRGGGEAEQEARAALRDLGVNRETRLIEARKNRREEASRLAREARDLFGVSPVARPRA